VKNVNSTSNRAGTFGKNPGQESEGFLTRSRCSFGQDVTIANNWAVIGSSGRLIVFLFQFQMLMNGTEPFPNTG
jgi:hypothetical protein